jgi:translocation and assembly module TamB
VSYRLAAADAITAGGSLTRSAEGALTGDGTIELSSAEDLIRRLAPTSELPLAGTASGAYRVEWPPGGLPSAAGVIDDLDLQLEARPVRLIEPARFRVSPAGVRLDGVNIAVRDDELFFRFAADQTGALSGNLAGTLDALLLRFLLPDWEPAGRTTGVVELLGTVDQPLFEGIAEVHQVSFRLPQSQTIFSGIDGTVLLSSDDVTLEGVDFRFMQGRGRTNGRIGRRNGTIDFALDGVAESLRFAVLPDLVAQLSGSWRLLGPVDDLELSGDLTVDSASLRSKEDIASLLLKWFSGDPKPPAADGGIELDIHVDADETIELRNPSLRLVGSASLQVSGTTGRPGLVGKLEFSEGGEVTLQTLRYEVERASFTFSDPEVIDPFIDIQARTWVQNYDVSLRITGTRGRLVPAVSSNPPLTQDQIYGLMALGRRSEGVGGTGAMGVGFASSILSGQLASEFDRRAGFSLPVDQVRVDPFAETDTGETGGARITLVKQLTRSWTVILQSNLTGAQEPVFISRWYIAPGIFVEASQDIEGSYGIDLMLRRPY